MVLPFHDQNLVRIFFGEVFGLNLASSKKSKSTMEEAPLHSTLLEGEDLCGKLGFIFFFFYKLEYMVERNRKVLRVWRFLGRRYGVELILMHSFGLQLYNLLVVILFFFFF